MTTACAQVPADLLDLLVSCTVAAVVAELRVNPGGDMTDRDAEMNDDVELGRESRSVAR